MSGKNFSGNSNPARHKNDFYQTPYNITRRLLEIEKFKGRILEPACGAGAITAVLKEAGYDDVTSYDLLLDGKERLDKIYSREILEKIYVFTRYPLLSRDIRADGKYETGMMVYAWYIFNTAYEGEPVIRWLDNDGDVVRKRK